MHPTSLNADDRKREDLRNPQGALFTFSSLAKSNDGSSLNMRDSTRVTPLMSAMFGGKLNNNRSNRLEMDEWLPLFVKASNPDFAGRMLLEFRKALDRVLNRAFRSLADVGAENQMAFGGDAITEQFANKVVDVLDHAGGTHKAPANPSWPQSSRWPQSQAFHRR